MSDIVIKNLPALLSDYLGSNRTVKDSKISYLTAPGENYGSIMLKLDITITNSDEGTEEILNTVAKMLPESEFYREMFNVQDTFSNEIAFYKTIVPTLREFQKELDVNEVIDCFPAFYGARLSLDETSSIVDDDASLILENLAVSGYSNIDRFTGFDLDGTKLVLKDLATLHAVSIALKLKKPEVFEKNVKATCLGDLDDGVNFFIAMIKNIMMENNQCAHLVSKIRTWEDPSKKIHREPFATLIHCDLWTNNTMQKFENNKPVRNKFVDFQIYDFGSPVSDLLFFLWTSVPKEVLEEYFDYFLRYYHEHFVKTIELHNCDTAAFSFDKFQNEIVLEVPSEIGHALSFAAFINYGKKGGHDDMTKLPDEDYYMEHLPTKAKEKVWYIVLECEKRGWL